MLCNVNSPCALENSSVSLQKKKKKNHDEFGVIGFLVIGSSEAEFYIKDGSESGHAQVRH